VRHPIVILLLALGLLLTAARLTAQTADVPRNAEDLLAAARAMTTAKDYAGAAKLLTRALDRYPTHAGLYLALADAQEAGALAAMTWRGDDEPAERFRRQANAPAFAALNQELFETYGRAIMYAANIRPVQQRIDDLVAFEFPTLLGRNGPVALPGEPAPVAFPLTDPQLPTDRRTDCAGLISSRPLPVTPHYRLDPKYGQDATFANHPVYGKWAFQRMLLAYEMDRPHRAWRLRFRVMWQEVPGKQEERATLAHQVAALLLRLSALQQAYTGLAPRFAEDGAINVWLTEKGDAGGEAYDNNIYLYNVSVPRSPTEWTREIAHEYGHQTMPPVGGYTKPEWGANGLLGERLYMRWLLLNRDTAESHPWVKALDPADVLQQRLGKLVEQFAVVGPDAPAMRGTDRTAMENFVGFAAYLEMTRGSLYLINVLKSLSTPIYAGGQGFLETLIGQETAYQSPANALVTLRLGALPANLPLWVYLREGTWKGEIDAGAQAVPCKVEIDGKPARQDDNGAFYSAALTKGWHRIVITADPPVELWAPRGLKLIRQ